MCNMYNVLYQVKSPLALTLGLSTDVLPCITRVKFNQLLVRALPMYQKNHGFNFPISKN